MLHTLLYLLALFSLSTSSNWAKLNKMPVEVLGFYRLGISALLLGIFILLSKKHLHKIKLDSNFIWAVASGAFFFLHLWTYKYAAKNTTISNTMIIFSSNPVWASIGAIVFFKEQIEKRLYWAYFFALSGVFLLLAHDFGMHQNLNLGDASAVISAAFYAAYMLTSKSARRFYDNLNYALIQYSVCALLFAFCIPITNSSLTGYDSTSWLAVAGLVALPTFLGHFSFTYLVKHMNIAMMTCGKLIEPLLASLIAYYLFQEKLGGYAWLAFLLTSISVLILFYPGLKSLLKPSRP